MTKIVREYMDFKDYLKGGSDSYYGPDRDKVLKLAGDADYELVHDEPGQYDPSIDGYLVFKSPEGDLWRVDFEDDSYSGGNMCHAFKVTAKTVEKVIYE